MIVKDNMGRLFYVMEKMTGGTILYSKYNTIHLSCEDFEKRLKCNSLTVEDSADIKITVKFYPWFENEEEKICIVEGCTTRAILDLYNSGKHRDVSYFRIYTDEYEWDLYRMSDILEVVEL